MMKRPLLLLLFVYAQCLFAHLSAQTLSLVSQRLSVSDGLLSNQVNGLLQDEEGYLWITTSSGLCRYDGHEFRDFTSLLPPQLGVNLGELRLDTQQHTLWVANAVKQWAAIDLSDMGNRAATGAAPTVGPRAQSIPFEANKEGDLWLHLPDGSTRTFHHLVPADILKASFKEHNYYVTQTPDSLVFIATEEYGLYVYQPSSDELTHYRANDQTGMIDTDTFSDILTDRNGTVWISSPRYGLTQISRPRYIDVRFLSETLGRHISCVGKGVDGSLVVKDISEPSHLCHFVDSKGRLWADAAYRDAVEDVQGRVWVATWGDGVLCDGQQVAALRKYEGNGGGNVRRLSLGPDGVLWAATNGGIVSINTRGGDYKSPQTDYKSPQTVKVYDTSGGQLPSNEVMTILATREGLVLYALPGKGVFVLGSDKVLTTADGLPTNNVLSMVQDHDGNIWIGNEYGVSVADAQLNRVRTYHIATLPVGNAFTDNAAIVLDDGTVAMGTLGGAVMMRVAPPPALPAGGRGVNTLKHKVVLPPAPPPAKGGEQGSASIKATITDVKVNGVSLATVPVSGLGGRSVNASSPVRLQHDENTLRFFFSDFVSTASQASLYQYYLESGITNPLQQSDDWLPPTADHSALFANLPPGTYTFHVRSLSGIAPAVGPEQVFTFTILQPWWNTWWAWMLWIALFTTVAGWLFWQWYRNFRLHQQLKLEAEVRAFNVQFFTHIAHEFRTPLTIIQNAAAHLQNDDGSSRRSHLSTLARGTKRMLRLVNQFMDFRRLDTGSMRLQVEQGDIVAFVRGIVDDFFSMAHQKEITLTFTPFARSHQMLFDPHLTEMMVYNLLSNAVKYTPPKGRVMVSLRLESSPTPGPSRLTIVVEDTGPGIANEEELFTPFMHGHVSKTGMGIGLYCAFQSAKIHRGQLSYERVSSDGGSRFTITMPATDVDFSAEDYQTETTPNDQTTIPPDDQAISDEATIMAPPPLNDALVVIVEDDPDMMRQISKEIGVYFQVKGYMTGKDALGGIPADRPALIVCDVMLPDIDGYEVVRTLKSDVSLSATPIVMLTALNDDAHQMKAYRAGADDYMTKPVNYEVLMARIVQLVKWHKERQTPTPTNDQTPTPPDDQAVVFTSTADKNFRERLQVLVAQHMHEESFNIETLAEMMQTGHTKFYGRVKELTGMTPNRYLQQERMRRAAQLVKEGHLNISEVAYKVGLSNLGYFTKCFKQQFGMTPKEYQQSN